MDPTCDCIWSLIANDLQFNLSRDWMEMGEERCIWMESFSDSNAKAIVDAPPLSKICSRDLTENSWEGFLILIKSGILSPNSVFTVSVMITELNKFFKMAIC